MAEIYSFFDYTKDDDRVYTADDYAKSWRDTHTNGVMEVNELTVSKGDGLNVSVSAGRANVQGYRYENTEDMTVTLSPASTSYPRIDRIVLRLDLTIANRYIKLFVKTGTPASSPTPPSLTRSNYIYEVSLAQVRIEANATTINTVTDERPNTDICGFVQSKVSVGTVLPPGLIMPYAAESVPLGWLDCNGQTVSRSVYYGLFNIIGTTYGTGDGSTTFQVPDLRDYFVVGKSASRSIGSKKTADVISGKGGVYGSGNQTGLMVDSIGNTTIINVGWGNAFSTTVNPNNIALKYIIKY